MKTPVVVAAGAVVIAALAAILRAPHPAPLAGSLPIREAATQPQRRPAATELVVYVAGQVAQPGVYTLPAGARVDRALRAAGGATKRADLIAVNLAEPLTDGEKVVVPAQGEAGAALDAAPTGSTRRSRHLSGRSGGPRRGRRHKAPPTAPVDLNAADATQLEELPGIGPSLAERIVAYRQLNGPFHTFDDLLDVAGMTDRRLDAISPFLVLR
jgi:competence protein ComEA